MAGRIKKITVEVTNMTDLQELTQLHKLVHEKRSHDLPGICRRLPMGTILKITSGEDKNRLAVVNREEPDSDGDYHCWFIGEDGELDDTYFNQRVVSIFQLPNGASYDFFKPPEGMEYPQPTEEDDDDRPVYDAKSRLMDLEVEAPPTDG
jgi:hypothetical protein